jgi:hypothetical protein
VTGAAPRPHRGRDLALLVAATTLSYPVGILSGSAWLLPSLNTLPAYLMMVARLREGDRRGALAAMLTWALTLAVCGTLFFALWPTTLEAVVLNGAVYRDEMFLWIRTGLGREGSPRLFLPQHLLHLVGFVALSLATASSLSILLGAVLMNFMAFYVASLARAGLPAWAVITLGWQPWAICRVAAFCTLGVVLAEPLLRQRFKTLPTQSPRKLLLWAACGILADWALKATLAPTWGRWLVRLLPGSGLEL